MNKSQNQNDFLSYNRKMRLWALSVWAFLQIEMTDSADPFIYLNMTLHFIFRAFFDVSLNLICVPLFVICVLVVQYL